MCPLELLRYMILLSLLPKIVQYYNPVLGFKSYEYQCLTIMGNYRAGGVPSHFAYVFDPAACTIQFYRMLSFFDRSLSSCSNIYP